MQPRTLVAMAATAVLAATPGVSIANGAPASQPTTAKPSAAPPSGSFALSGDEARDFVLPADVREVHTSSNGHGGTTTRYQQVVGNASVFGGQVTVIQDASGDNVAVIGAYFPGLEASNTLAKGKVNAKSIVADRIGDRGNWRNALRIDPRTGRYFYEVQSLRSEHRPVRWVNADTGNIIKSYDAIAHGEGEGVKGDTKTFDTTQNGSVYELRTPDDRQATYDMGNKTAGDGTLMTDEDDVWNFNRQNWSSPSQAPGVDAHYYAGVVDDFYADVFGRNSIDDQGMQIVSRVHYDRNYCNAFWNGEVMTYGDGNGRDCLPLSGGLDVDSHELTHGVTEFTSNLIYEDEPGALNEAFSDMMGNTSEFYAADNGLDPAATPDWRIGEDVINPDTPATAGFRNMGDPAEFGDPDHYVDLYTGDADNGGVHSNSGIPNHAYYLTVNGGQNAGCTATATRPATHTEDCDVTVPALGVDQTAQIYYDGFTGLAEYANMCDARNATVAAAGDDAAAATAVNAGWQAVGVHEGCTQGTPPPPPCVSDADASIPFESPHPYGNNGDCTWTYDNGTAGFAFHFSLLDTEADYDYVYVKDADGNIVDTFDGLHRRGATSSCIPTSSGSVQLVSDSSVTAQGFTVDAVEAC